MGVEFDVAEKQVRHLLAEAKLHAPFRLSGEVTPKSVSKLREDTYLHADMFPSEPIVLEITSHGGYAFEGFALFDHLRELSANGSKVTTVIRGFAGSMAGILSQAGDERLMGAQSYLHIHEASNVAFGKTQDIFDEANLLKRIDKQAAAIYAKRSTLTAAQILVKIERKELYLNAREAKALGFVDKVA